MKIATHKKVTLEKFGVEAADIHEWIDGLFDHKSFNEFCRTGVLAGFNPYEHRKYRHCKEAVEEAIEIFKDRYTEDIIRKVFESHVREDYFGYYPSIDDFGKEKFLKKYHIY
ncbi:MAG: hypothetical protein A2020_00155 [Lentisphaerae bacterium GWF2_45_14]|nr:MAG: hypothetical protein A2020_00155 [Lentisphaerae bacterium GWF2_45_14]